MFDKIGISVQGNFVRRQEGVLLRKSGRKLKSLFYLTIIVVLCIFLGGCNKKGEITFEQAADEVFSEEISNQSEVGESKETERMKAGGTDVETDAWIYVDVAGAVRTPGVVKLARGARVYEAIELAGGFAKDAAISAVNQASVLQDGQQLYIVTVEEQKTKQLSSSEGSLETSGEGRVADAGKVNINQASEEFGVTLSEENKQSILELMKKIDDLDLDVNQLKDQISNLYDKLDSMGIHIDLDSEEVQGFFSKIVEFIKDFLNRLG